MCVAFNMARKLYRNYIYFEFFQITRLFEIRNVFKMSLIEIFARLNYEQYNPSILSDRLPRPGPEFGHPALRTDRGPGRPVFPGEEGRTLRRTIDKELKVKCRTKLRRKYFTANKQSLLVTSSHGLVVMADSSRSRGCGFKPRHPILDGCKQS